MRVAIAGASGFVGQALRAALEGTAEVVGLSRQTGAGSVRANLFSLKDVEEALAGADVAVYLVHSMMPPSRLTQGAFEDLDVILADNFARAAKFCGVKRIIYLGGLIPSGDLSPHLASRHEVEAVLGARGTPLTSLRAGLIIGPGGSSFEIMARLIERLPVLLCPKWTQGRCQPIAVDDVVALLKALIQDEQSPTGSFDVGGPEVLSYKQMMLRTADIMGRRRRFFEAPVFSPALSRLWVSLITGSPKALVYPLIESLRHDMIAGDVALQERYGIRPRSFDVAVRQAIAGNRSVAAYKRKRAAVRAAKTVTSVQRLRLDRNLEIALIGKEYVSWLRHLFSPLLRVETAADGSIVFLLGPLSWLKIHWVLLSLEFSPGRSGPTRQLFYINGGWLLRRSPGAARGRLEFRAVPGSHDVLTAVLDFRPRLPWRVYRYSQALVHLLIMNLFRRHLQATVRRVMPA